MIKPYFETELGKLYHGDCLEIMPELSAGSVDLVVTSPPYDELLDYKGMDWDYDIFAEVAAEVWRVGADGGVVVWVVGDATVEGSETGTSFRQALAFKDLGFRLHDTMIYEKAGCFMPSQARYLSSFEYMFVLSKGRPKAFNPIKDRLNWFRERWGGGRSVREKDGGLTYRGNYVTKDYGIRFNIWRYATGYGRSHTDKLAYGHPATFPEKLAADHIISWSNPGDLVLDPFFGAGTTGKMSEKLNRRWVGIEISEEYCEIAAKRIKVAANQGKLFDKVG